MSEPKYRPPFKQGTTADPRALPRSVSMYDRKPVTLTTAQVALFRRVLAYAEGKYPDIMRMEVQNECYFCWERQKSIRDEHPIGSDEFSFKGPFFAPIEHKPDCEWKATMRVLGEK